MLPREIVTTNSTIRHAYKSYFSRFGDLVLDNKHACLLLYLLQVLAQVNSSALDALQRDLQFNSRRDAAHGSW